MKTIIFLSVIAVGVGFVVRSTLEINQRGGALSALAGECAEMRESASRLERRIANANDTRRANHPPATATATAETHLAAEAQRRLSPQSIIANGPVRMAEYAKNFRTALEMSHGGMFKALGLSAEQIEKLKDLLVSVEQRRMDLIAAIESQGLDLSSDTFKKLNAENQKFRMAKEAEILGDLEERYREYYRAQAVRNPTQRLAAAALYSGEPVGMQQVEQTVQILAANSQREPKGVRRGWVMGNTVNWSVAGDQLKEVLSPGQIATLRSFIEHDARETKANEQVNQQVARLSGQFKGQLGN